LPFYAGAIVVIVPLEPLNFNAPASTYIIPPLDGLDDGTVVAFAI
jgi:hypothetical protein